MQMAPRPATDGSTGPPVLPLAHVLRALPRARAHARAPTPALRRARASTPRPVMGGRALQAAAGRGAQRLVHVHGEHGVPRAAHAHGAVVRGHRPHRRRVHCVAGLLEDLLRQGRAVGVRARRAQTPTAQADRFKCAAAGRGRC